MGKKATRFMLFAFILTLIIIAGCGGKSQEKVTKKIEGALGDIDGYKVEAKMTMKTGQEERSYDIDIWYKKDKQEFYRVTLESEEEDGGQVILKNEEGVFVLTPDRKSTRLNSSHVAISYAVFCLKKKKKKR